MSSARASYADRASQSFIEALRGILFYDADTGALTWKKRPMQSFVNSRAWAMWNKRFAGRPAGCVGSRGYQNVKVDYQTLGGHRIAWAIYYGEWPEGEIDHINGDKLDNRICNLRAVSAAENMKNLRTPATNSSGVMGVSFVSRINRWRAYIRVNGRATHIGYFMSKEDAARARNLAAEKFGYHKNHGRPAVAR